MLEAVAAIAGVIFVGAALLDAFETIVLPRRVRRSFRLARFFFYNTWRPWSQMARRMPGGSREAYLSFYAPLFLIVLIAVWAVLQVVGFGLVHWAYGNVIDAGAQQASLWDSIYLSGTTFFTLGVGDVRPGSTLSRVITVVEGGAGFAFLALVVTYVPVLYQAFSRREINVSLLDARAGSPPSAGEYFRRMDASEGVESLRAQLREWEVWTAELLEIHLSYPLLALYRSQHERQSWLAALTLILDVCAVVVAGGAPGARREARLTFAMARHAAVDLSQVLAAAPGAVSERLSAAEVETLKTANELLLAGLDAAELAELRLTYEPHVASLSRVLLMPLPAWLPAGDQDAWETTPWDPGRRIPLD